MKKKKISIIGITIALFCAGASAQYTNMTHQNYTSGARSLTNVAFRNINYAGTGAALYISNANVTIHNALFETNRAAPGQGGAIYNRGGSVTISDATFTGNNVSHQGGAIYNYSGSVTISNATFTGNHSEASGGAIYNLNPGNMTLTDVSFYNNTGSTLEYNGGAIRNDGGTLTLNVSVGKVSTFSGNRATYGNGIYQNSGSLTVNTIGDGVLDLQDSMFATNNATVTKIGDGTWKIGQTNNLTAAGMFSVNEGELFLYDNAVLNVKSLSISADGAVGGDGDLNITTAFNIELGGTVDVDTFSLGSAAVTASGFSAGDNWVLVIAANTWTDGIGNVLDRLNAATGNQGLFKIDAGSIYGSTIPEPAAILMLAGVAGVIGFYRRFFCKI